MVLPRTQCWGSDLGEGIEDTLSQFTHDTKLGRNTDLLRVEKALQRGQEKQESCPAAAWGCWSTAA